MAGEGDAERLVVLLEARIRDFERNLKKASGTAKRNYDEITAGSSRAGRTLSKTMADAAAKANSSLASFGKGFVGGLAAGAVAEFTGAIKGAVSSVAELKAESQQAGVGVEAFQKLQAAALQAKVGTDALVDGLKEMQLRIDEFVTTGSGSASESLQRLGYDAEDLKKKLKNPSDLFLELIARIQRLDTAARIRVSDELFGGTAGEQFVRLVDLGADKVEQIGREAEAAGRIIESDLVDRAADLDRRFNVVAATIRQNLVGAVVAASDAMGPLVRQSDALGASLQRFIDDPNWLNFNAFMMGGSVEQQARSAAQPTQQLTRAMEERKAAQAQLDSLRSDLADPGRASMLGRTKLQLDISDAETRLKALEQREAALSAKVNDPREMAVAQARSNLNAPSAAGPVDQSNLPPVPERKPNLLDYDPNGRASSAGATRTERDAVNDLITSLEEELRLVQATDAERAIANNLRAAGAEATETQRQRIEDLTRAYYAESDAVERAREAQQAAIDAQQFFADATYDALDGLLMQGDSLNDVFANLAKTIAQAALQAAILGQGPLAGLLGLGGKDGGVGGIIGAVLGAFTKSANGNVFSHGRVTPFARGGIVSSPTLFPMANGAGLMGEAGPEAVMPLRRGSDGKLGVAAPGGGPRTVKMQISLNQSIDLKGANGDDTIRKIVTQATQEAAPRILEAARRSLPKWQSDFSTFQG